MIRSVTFALLISATTAAPSSTLAQSTAQAACAPRDLIVSKLQDSYGESRVGAGLRGSASLLEIWSSADSGTWTILMTNTEGISCIMASGDNWHGMSATPAVLGAPA